MKKLFTIIILIIGACSFAFSQSYIPLATQNAHWNCNFNTGSYSTQNVNYYDLNEMTYLTGGDTVIGITTYCKIFRSIDNNYYYINHSIPISTSYYIPSAYFGALRNDSVNRKVFFLPVDSLNEKLLYDFNVNVGDTIEDWYSAFHYGHVDVVVQSIDSVLINMSYRRRINFISIYTGNYPELIEGIGATTGLLNPLNYGKLECFSENFQTIYPDTVTICDDIHNSVSEIKNEFSFPFPNPSTGKFRFNGLDINSEITIYNLLGNIIYQNRNSEPAMEIDLTNQPKGIYFCKLLSKNYISETFKIIIQ